MSIQVPVRKGLKAKFLVENRPDLSKSQVARMVGMSSNSIQAAISKEHF